jgi:predicted nucleic acid-binding protein
MPVLVDTNVLSDVIHQDPVWSAWSSEQLIQHAGDLVVNPIIFAELCCRATSAAEVAQIIRTLSLDYEELSQEALFLAAKAFMAYRRQSGGKTSPLPDFFIGAHAEAVGYTLLTRDKGRYQTYFPTVPLISP